MGAALGCVDERHEAEENPENRKENGAETGNNSGAKGRAESPWQGRHLKGTNSRGRSMTPKGSRSGSRGPDGDGVQGGSGGRTASGRRVSFKNGQDDATIKSQSSWTWGGSEEEPSPPERGRTREQVTKTAARRNLHEAALTLDVEAIQQAIYQARAAGLVQSELEEANEAKLRGHTMRKARVALSDAVRRHDEDALRAAVEQAHNARLSPSECEEALALIAQLEAEDEVAGGPRGPRQKALQRLEAAIKLRRDQDLREAVDYAESIGIGKDDLQYCNAKQLLKTNESRRRMARERREREAANDVEGAEDAARATAVVGTRRPAPRRDAQ